MNNHSLDALLHATAPLELPEVRKLLIEQKAGLIGEFVEDLKNLPTPSYQGTRVSIKMKDFYGLIMKWEKKQGK